MSRIELYREASFDHVDQRPQYRWRFVKNGRIMADSGQGYSRRIDCLHGAAVVLGGAVERDGIFRTAGIYAAEWVEVRDLTRKATP